MRRDHAEQIMAALEPSLRLPNEKVRELLVQKIMDVNLKPGREPITHSKSDYIDQARKFAKEWLQQNPVVCVQDVVENLSLPPELPPDTVGGIFKHPDFQKVGKKQITMPKGHRPKTKYVNTYVLAGTQNDLIVQWD
jgi:hypothetical protein